MRILSLLSRPAFAGLLALAAALPAQAQMPLPAAVNTDPARAQVALPEPANPALPSLILIGDSTVRNGRDDGQGKGPAGQWGWGNPIAAWFDPARINVVNRAVGGLSSRTYLTSGHWERTLAFIKPGDIVLMQFGHNDAAPLNDDKRARGTIRGSGDEAQEIDNILTGKHETVHSYGWYLRKFIADTRAKGATPVVVSLIPRKAWDEQGKVRRNKGDYAGWAEAVARSEHTGFIDLNEQAASRYDALGHDAVMNLFPLTNPDEHVHTNWAGAQLNAQIVVAGLKSLGDKRITSSMKPAEDDRPVVDAKSVREEAPVNSALPTLFLVGDSTVKSGGVNGAIGWGERIAPYFDARKINVVNAAIGGRSSRTFYTEGRWDKVLAQLKRGDVVIVQFGHNDGGRIGDPAMKNRASAPGIGPETVEDTRPDGSREQVHSFGWYMARYVADARAKGATVILASPIPHRDKWQEGRDFATFADWDKQVAGSGGAQFMDLTMLVADGYRQLGAARVDTLFADARTHTNVQGADFNAGRVVAGLKTLPGNPLGAYFSDKAAAEMMKNFLLIAAALSTSAASLAAPSDVTLNWVGDAPQAATGVSWGVPWARGTVQKDQSFALKGADGKALPLQTWPLAYWPDGSIKFSGFATVAQAAGPYTISAGEATKNTALAVQSGSGYVDVSTGASQVRVGTRGTDLIQSIRVDGREVAKNGRLVGLLQQGPDPEEGAMPARTAFASSIDKVTVEQSGPVRAVIKVEGKHKLAKGGRSWLPFSLRLYFYANDPAIHVVHTVTYDGDQRKDFIRGLGLRFTVPMREDVYNRHVAFGGQDGGLWMESLQPGDLNADPRQVAGQKIDGGRFYGRRDGEKEQLAIWSDYKLTQPTPNGFNIVKRTGAQSTWVFSDSGKRASGLAFVGDVSGGLAVSVKDFWQSFPTAFDVRNAGGKEAELTAWLWSPDAPAMDMRHYATRAHGLQATYEDVQAGMSQAYGVARTSEFTLNPSSAVPARAQLTALARAGATRALLSASPAAIHAAGVFGVWAPVDRSTPARAAVEDKLDATLAFYKQQQDDRNWYGFWTWGDFIHSYNFKRHVWNYDHGGFAWDNTELGTALWVWTSYLRSGRADLFRMAEALARNTSETNVYHLGPMLGLGSRHNVVKWGDGSKEGRISQAAHWRPFYYLTTDERIGDIMREQLQSDKAMVKYDPMRLAQPVLPQDPKYPGRIRLGPDWYVLAGNWMTEWERSGDTRWRDRIIAGVDSILAMPYWLRSGVNNGLNPDIGGGKIGPLKGRGSMTVGYDPASGKLFPIPDPIEHAQVPVLYNLSTIQGGAQVMFELVPLLGREDFAKAWLQYARLGEAPGEVLLKDKATGTEGANAQYVEKAQGGPRLAAYAYAQTRNPAFAKVAIDNMSRWRGASSTPLAGPDVLNPTSEALGVSTNDAAQSGLTMIESMALLGDAMPNELPPPPPASGRRGGK